MHHLLVCGAAGREHGAVSGGGSRAAVAPLLAPGRRAPRAWRCRWRWGPGWRLRGAAGAPGAAPGRHAGPIQRGGAPAPLPKPLLAPPRAAIGPASPRAGASPAILLQAPPPSSTFLDRPTLLLHPECEGRSRGRCALKAPPCPAATPCAAGPAVFAAAGRSDRQISARQWHPVQTRPAGSATRPSAARSAARPPPRLPSALCQRATVHPSSAPARGQPGEPSRFATRLAQGREHPGAAPQARDSPAQGVRPCAANGGPPPGLPP